MSEKDGGAKCQPEYRTCMLLAGGRMVLGRRKALPPLAFRFDTILPRWQKDVAECPLPQPLGGVSGATRDSWVGDQFSLRQDGHNLFGAPAAQRCAGMLTSLMRRRCSPAGVSPALRAEARAGKKRTRSPATPGHWPPRSAAPPCHARTILSGPGRLPRF